MLRKNIFHIIIIACAALCTAACGSKQTTATTTQAPVVTIAFNEDSAYSYCQMQCDFGPRTMNSKAHDDCGAWIASAFKAKGCDVTLQQTDLQGWDNTTLKATNIIARTNPTATQRILVCAHWDSRPWADNDPDRENWHKPVMAANDGASGVAVMLELARLIALRDTALSIGIDFVCFDAEDYGAPEWSDIAGTQEAESTWALGAQYFANYLPDNYEYGLLLDMVGGQGATFYQEGFSAKYAQSIMDRVWEAAATAGYASQFTTQQGGYITDDHIPLNKAGIPTVDIIPYYPDCEQSSFGPTWHTVSDTMENIDRQTLKAVGQTLVQHLFAQ